MTVTAALLKKMIADELLAVSDTRIVDHINAHLTEPQMEHREWDYGEPGENYRCWMVLRDPVSYTGIAYCEEGFGPRCPWGLLWTGGEDNPLSMGPDSSWFQTFLLAYLDSFVVTELPIWRVFWNDPDGVKQPISDEGDWNGINAQVEAYRKKDPQSHFESNCDLGVQLRR